MDTTSAKHASAVVAEVERVLRLNSVAYTNVSMYIFDCQVRPRCERTLRALGSARTRAKCERGRASCCRPRTRPGRCSWS